MNIKLLVISPLPPTRTGIAEYAYEFYKALSNELKLIIITNRTSVKNEFHPHTVLEFIDNLASLELLRKIVKLVNKHDVKYVHIQVGLRIFGSHINSILITVAALLLLRFMRKRPIITLHTIPTKWALTYYFKDKKIGKFQAFLVYLVYKSYIKLISKLSWRTIVHLDIIKKYLVSFYRVTREKIEVLPHGTICKKNAGVKKKNEVILFHGFLRKSKGLDVLLNAYSNIKNGEKLSLKLIGPLHIGETNYLKNLIAKIKKLEKSNKIQVKPRHLNLEEIINEMAKAKVIVLPYEDYFLEASGVLAKAACSGTPIICSKTPKFYFEKDYREYLTFFEPKDEKDLENKIATVLKNYGTFKAKAKKLRDMAEKRTWDKIAKKFAKIITQGDIK